MPWARMAGMVVIVGLLAAGPAGAQGPETPGRPLPPVFDQETRDRARSDREVWQASLQAADRRTKDAEVRRANAEWKGRASRVRDSLLPPSARATGLVRDGWAAIHRREFEGAEAVLDEAIRAHPWYAEAHVARGVARHDRGDLVGAIADYDRAIRLDAGDWRGYHHRALALLHGRDSWAALDSFSGAIELFPEVAQLHAGRAEVRLALRDARGARADAERALELDPDHREAMDFWMEALDKSGDDATLKLVLDSGVEILREDPDPSARRALLLTTSPDPEVRNPSAALEDALRAESLSHGRSRAALRAKAAAQAALGDYPSAVGTSVRAVFAEPSNRDMGTDLVRLATFLARRPVTRRPWPAEPPDRAVHRLKLGVGVSSKIGAYLDADLDRVVSLRAALPRDLPIPLAVARWSPRGAREFLDSIRGGPPSTPPGAHQAR